MTGMDAQDSQRFFATLDRAKGILIVLIVFAHNTLITKAWPESRAFLYNWHVFAFLLLAMVMPFNSEKPGFLTTRFIRYYIPFVVFFTLTWFANVILDGSFSAFGTHVAEWALAVAIGSADLLDIASGARLFWFLPALMGLVIIRWAIARAPQTMQRRLLTGIAVGGFLAAGLIPDGIKPWLPFGLPIALYVLGPGLLFAAIIRGMLSKDLSKPVLWLLTAAASAACALLYAFTHKQGTALVLASFNFYDLRSPLALVSHALLAIVAAASVMLFSAAIGRSRAIEWLGQASLLIYLVHQIVFVGLRAIAQRVGPGIQPNDIALAAIATFIGTMIISAAIAWVIQSVPVMRRLIAPRDWKEWSGALKGAVGR